MLYITTKTPPKTIQFSFEDMLFGVNEEKLSEEIKDTHSTRTYTCACAPTVLFDRYKETLKNANTALAEFCIKYADLIERNNNGDKTLYRSFKIPKRNGKMRQINAPNSELMEALRELKYIIEEKCMGLYHTSAYAYVKGRSTIDAVKRHQANKSRWFLKLDFHDFFGSTTLEFVIQQLKMIFPFNLILGNSIAGKIFQNALSLCFLDGGLPQGTPISPTITNLMMIPIDHELSKMLRNYPAINDHPTDCTCSECVAGLRHIIYTRYADDLLLSCQMSFKWTEVQKSIVEILNNFNAPFKLNESKTRYGSNAGSNWNLGVMLNKDNEITIGHKKRELFRATLFSFMADYTKNSIWSLEDVQVLAGQISYYKMVNLKSVQDIIDKCSAKFNSPVMDAIKSILNHSITQEVSA